MIGSYIVNGLFGQTANPFDDSSLYSADNPITGFSVLSASQIGGIQFR